MKAMKKNRPVICYRPIGPSDLSMLETIHAQLFPIRYESEFFQNVVHGRDIVSWAAVDRNHPNAPSDELIGFVTARLVVARDSEIGDLVSASPSDQTLVYILTLGVVEPYRNHGIASSLIHEVLKYARAIPTCRGAYLHVISYTNAAIHLYNKMSFKCVRRLDAFYLINGHHYDSYLFLHYLNGARSSCSPLQIVLGLVRHMRFGLQWMSAHFWRNEDPRWPKSREARCLISTECECV